MPPISLPWGPLWACVTLTKPVSGWAVTQLTPQSPGWTLSPRPGPQLPTGTRLGRGLDGSAQRSLSLGSFPRQQDRLLGVT